MGVMGLPLLVDAALKGTIVLLAATAVVMVLRRNSAASRHVVWQLALLAMLGLPVIRMVTPWHLPLLPQLRSPVVTEAADPKRAPETPLAAGAQHEPTTSNAIVQAPPTVQTHNATSSAEPAAPFTLRVLYWLGVAWLTIAAALIVRLLLGFALVRWFAMRAYPLYDDGWTELNHDLAALAGVRRTVQLYASPHIATPMTWGFTHPVIMLPSSAEDWTAERRRVVLLHEMAHIRRRDSLAHFLAQLTCAVYWFHPLVWRAAARMRAEAERAADDLVLRSGTKPSVYADHLLELIRTIGNIRTPALALPMAQRSTFEGRLLAILEPNLDRTAPRPVSVLAMVVVLGMIVFPLAGLTTASAINTEASRFPEVPDWGADSPNLKPHKSSQKAVLTFKFDQQDNAQGVAGKDVAKLAGDVQQPGISAHVRASLLGALTDAVAEVRIAAIEALGESQDSAVIAALARALRTDTDARVRKMAAWALGNIEDRAAVPALSDALRDSDADVRQTAVWALGQIEDRSSVPALLQALKSDDVAMRREVVWALGQIEDATAVPGLAAALRDSDAGVRRQAVWALGQIESPTAVEPLITLANDPDAETRSQVAWALGQIENAGAVAALGTMLRNDKVADVRKMAAWALGQIESAEAVPALAGALKDPVENVREQSAWALGQIEARPAPQALIDALKDSSERVRAMALWALSQTSDEHAMDALAEMLKDSNPEVRRAAAAALAGKSNPKPRPQPQPKPRPRPID